MCMSRAMTIYALALVLENGIDQDFDLLVLGDDSLSDEYLEILLEARIRNVSLEIAENSHYVKLFIQPYQNFLGHRKLLRSLKFLEICYFSDAMRNGMYSFPKLDPRVTELHYFGFHLKEEAFDSNLEVSQFNIRTHIVPFKTIRETWNNLVSRLGVKITNLEFEIDDFLIVLRHWGSPIYPIVTDFSILDYVLEESHHWKVSERIIIKTHPWVSLDQRTLDNFIEKLSTITGAEILLWSDLVPEFPSFPELVSPESILWEGAMRIGSYFGFDSSLNCLVAINAPETQIVYPNKSVYEKYFSYGRTTELVDDQLDWHRNFEVEYKKLNRKSSIEVSTSGIAFEKALLGVMINDGDALTQERDALTQERDALTQERDALTTSTIWRLTGPLRKILNTLKY